VAVTLYLIRHAHAGNKHGWSGPDAQRPLSDRGHAQAEGVADRFATAEMKRIISSPAVRCRQTVEPLAERLGLSIEEDESLAEDASTKRTLKLLHSLAADGFDAALCSHGDVIPAVVRALEGKGLKGDGNTASAKGGVFILETDGGRINHFMYVPPPDATADDH
jgi:broad specificity phosphatase PhoE